MLRSNCVVNGERPVVGVAGCKGVKVAASDVGNAVVGVATDAPQALNTKLSNATIPNELIRFIFTPGTRLQPRAVYSLKAVQDLMAISTTRTG